MNRTTPAAIIPQPLSVRETEGEFLLTRETCIVADETTLTTAAALNDALRPALGRQLNVSATPPTGSNAIICRLDSSLTTLGAEGYQLEVTPRAVTLQAPALAGLFYAVQTLRQLLPPRLFSQRRVAGDSWPIPAVTIKDRPRFVWRGLMLDTGHDFLPLSYLFRFIDLMALHKFNLFHWHIADHGNFPLQLDGYPELQNPDHRGPRIRGNPPRRVRIGSYTREEVRAVVAYAAARHITTMPEIDLPGHSTTVLNAYPHLDCPGPIKEPGEGVEWSETLRWEYCLGNEESTTFLKDVLSQVMALFPSQLIHIGGDECPTQHWERCPVCQARCRSEGLANVAELRLWFLKRIERFLADHGRRMIGWDELFENGVETSTAIMAWRADKGIALPAARAGHDVVIAATSHLYFDYSEERTPLAKVYDFEPLPAGLEANESARILGAQAQLWTNNHMSEAECDRLLYPRSCALAEVVWSAPERRNLAEFQERLQRHRERLANGFNLVIP